MVRMFTRMIIVALVGWLTASCDPGRARTGGAGEIAVAPLATLGDEAAGGGVGPFFTLAESPTGDWLLSYVSASQSLMAFSETGEYLRTVGRSGRGPGEFRHIQHVRTSDSLIHVLDAGQRRWSRLTPDLVWLDSRPLEVEGPSFVVLGDTAAVVNVRSFRYGMKAPPVRVYYWDGPAAIGLGDTLDLTDPLENAGAGRILAPGRDGTSVWVGYAEKYRVEHWALTGESLGVVERTVDWFPPGTGTYLPTPDEAPPAQIVGVSEGKDGRLWVAVTVPDSAWLKGVVKSEVPEGTGYQIGDRNRFLDTIIEVLDPETGALLATRRFDAALTLIRSGRAASYHEDGAGVPRIEILSLTVRP